MPNLYSIQRFFSKHRTGMLFLAPAVALNLVFFIQPLIRVIQMSFYNWRVIGTNKFLGLGNYQPVNDPLFGGPCRTP